MGVVVSTGVVVGMGMGMGIGMGMGMDTASHLPPRERFEGSTPGVARRLQVGLGGVYVEVPKTRESTAAPKPRDEAASTFE